MRRNDREITDRKDIDDIIRRCRVCHLAMCDERQPYVVPLNFGYDGCFLYFHAAREGRKIDIIRRNNRVGFEFDILHDIVISDKACNCSARYESVIGSGIAVIVDTIEDKIAALKWIMRQYENGARDFIEKKLDDTLVIRVEILEISGKARQ
jgi:nitroimidazol reductase NimA-like FMN-containing flavoprotein (pyridoxamine 5'-phosphate oxidase superfamily)